MSSFRILFALSVAALVASARAQISELGAAANYAALDLGSGNTFTISGGAATVTGNIGLSAGDNLQFSGGGVVTNNLDAGGSSSTVVISGGSVVDGTTTYNDSNLTTLAQDVQTASTYYADLTPTQTLSSLGAQTITGDGGLNVINVSGEFNLSAQTLVISGTSSDNFVFNIDSSVTLQGTSNIELEGISPDQVVFNLLGSSSGGNFLMTTSGNTDANGIFIAENGSIQVSGGVSDAEFISGENLTLHSGPTINQPDNSFSAVPEMNPLWLAAAAVAFLAGAEAIRSRALRRPQAA